MFIERTVNEGMICLDVGANIGEVSLHLSKRVGQTGRVYSFEPMPSVFRRLNGNVLGNPSASNVRHHQIALANKDGTSQIYFPGEQESNQGTASMVYEGGPSLERSMEISTRSLDSFVAQHCIPRIDLIKVDIQGAEFLFLRGAGRVLSESGPDLLVEVSPAELNAAGHTSRDLVLALEGYGYEVFELTRSGEIGALLCGGNLEVDYYADNVFCRKHRREPRDLNP